MQIEKCPINLITYLGRQLKISNNNNYKPLYAYRWPCTYSTVHYPLRSCAVLGDPLRSFRRSFAVLCSPVHCLVAALCNSQLFAFYLYRVDGKSTMTSRVRTIPSVLPIPIPRLVLLWSSLPTSPPRWIASTASPPPPPPRWQLIFSTVGVQWGCL